MAEYKPAFGTIFEQYLTEYSHWCVHMHTLPIRTGVHARRMRVRVHAAWCVPDSSTYRELNTRAMRCTGH